MILINIYLLCNIILTFPFTRKGVGGGGEGDEESSSFKLTDAARWGGGGGKEGERCIRHFCSLLRDSRKTVVCQKKAD